MSITNIEEWNGGFIPLYITRRQVKYMETLIYSVLAILMLLSPGPTDYLVPETIDVRITGEQMCYDGIRYHVETIDFKEYVKGVMVNEWGHNWDEESLKVGAVAIKMYAWSYIEAGGKYYDADVYDCHWDQVYNPDLRYESTDKAVDDTWDQVLIHKNSGDLIRTYYNAWYGGCQERKLEGQCIGQWNSKFRADNGMSYEDILYAYYDNSILVTAYSVVMPKFGWRMMIR